MEMKNLVFALMLFGIGSCNRTEGVVNVTSTDEMGADMALVPSNCGGAGQLCCSDGDGLLCSDGLICINGALCLLPATDDMESIVTDMSVSMDMTLVPDLSDSPVDPCPEPDMSGPDNETCECDDWVNHGQGKNHCLWYQHDSIFPANGHGNGLYRYDCK